MNLADERKSRFFKAVERKDPTNRQVTEHVINELLDWTGKHPDLTVVDRGSKQALLQVGVQGTGHLVWVARTFSSTGTFITLLGWGSGLVPQAIERELRQRLNAIRREKPLSAGQELRVRIDDLNSDRALANFMDVLDFLVAQARAAA